jgi:Domain of unknown function (DUF4340)
VSKRATLVLAALVALLGVYIAIFERDSLTSKELGERKGRVLPTFVRDKVTRLTLTRAGKRAVLERAPPVEGEPSSWKLIEPARAEADSQTVDQLLGELEWLSARRVIDGASQQDRTAFGLERPSYVLGYRVAGDDHTLRIGKTDVHGESYYASLDAEPSVYVVPKTAVEALDHEPGHFRTKQFVGSIVTAWAQRIELRGPQGAVTLLKDGATWWVQTEPKSHADAKLVSELVDKLDGLRAQRYLDGDGKRQALAALSGGERRSVELRVVPDEHREDKVPALFVLQFAGVCPGHPTERVARAGDKADPVCVLADELAPFEADAQALRLARPFAADPSEVESLTLRAGASQLTLKREGENWTEPGQKPDREAVEAWLAELSAQRASGVLPVREIAADFTLALSLVGDKKLELRADLDEPAGRVLVRRGDEPALAVFAPALADLLQPFAMRFAGLSPWAAKQPSQVIGLDVRDGKLARKLTNEQGSWRTKAGAPPLKEDLRVRELVRDLIKLRLLVLDAERPRSEHGLTPPGAALRFTLAQGAPPLSLELGAQGARGRYARVDGGPVALVGAEVSRALLELAGGTPPPLPQPEAGPPDEHLLDLDEEEHEHDHAHE